jgi:hypothetical protein
MKIGRHLMVTDAQRVELWRRYRGGETVHSIANVLGQRSSSNISCSGSHWPYCTCSTETFVEGIALG